MAIAALRNAASVFGSGPVGLVPRSHLVIVVAELLVWVREPAAADKGIADEDVLDSVVLVIAGDHHEMPGTAAVPPRQPHCDRVSLVDLLFDEFERPAAGVLEHRALQIRPEGRRQGALNVGARLGAGRTAR